MGDTEIEERQSADTRAVATIDIPTFLASGMLATRGLGGLIAPLGGIPINAVGSGLLGLIGMFRRPRWKVDAPLVTGAAFLLVAWLLITTLVINGDFELRRSGNIVALFLAAGVIASGRVHFRSLQTGAFWGFVGAVLVSIGLLFTSRGDGGYGNRLTGVLGDPNAAGYIVTTLGLAIAQGMRPGWRRWALFGFIGVTVWFTVSRTSMFALAVAALWIVFAKRLPLILNAAVLFSTTWLYQWAIGYMDTRGLFQEREGSDLLRERLLIIEQQMVSEAGWFGNGLGTAIADLGNGVTLFFHNSYLAMHAEGGLIALVLTYALMVGLFLMIHRLPGDRRPVWAEAGVIAGFICSINIGFSLTSPAIAIAIGLLLYHHCEQRTELDPAPLS